MTYEEGQGRGMCHYEIYVASNIGLGILLPLNK